MTNSKPRPTYQLPLALGLVGVAVGAAIGAGTGMWWMMGVLGAPSPVLRSFSNGATAERHDT